MQACVFIRHGEQPITNGYKAAICTDPDHPEVLYDAILHFEGTIEPDGTTHEIELDLLDPQQPAYNYSGVFGIMEERLIGLGFAEGLIRSQTSSPHTSQPS